MDPLLIAVILLFVGLVLLVAEAVLPSHGIIGSLAAAFLVGASTTVSARGPGSESEPWQRW